MNTPGMNEYAATPTSDQIYSVHCPVCNSDPGMGCDMRLFRRLWLRLGFQRSYWLTGVHDERIQLARTDWIY